MRLNLSKLIDLLQSVDNLDLSQLSEEKLTEVLNQFNKSGMALVAVLNFIKSKD